MSAIGGFNVEVDQDDLARVTRKLHGVEQDARKAIRNAANGTATKARKMLREEAQRRYVVKNAGFNRHSKIKRATLANLTATITVEGKPLRAPHFHISAAAKYGVKMEDLRGGGMKVLSLSGGSAGRAIGEKTKSTDIKAFMGHGQNSGASMVFQRRGKDRYPIKAIHGPSPAKMVEMIYKDGQFTSKAMKEEITQLYHENLNRQIARML